MGGCLKKVLILFGGNSFEHEVSCQSVNFVVNNIDTKLFDYKLVGIDFNNEWYEVNKNIEIDNNWKNNILKSIDNITEYLKDFDVVFPVIHGYSGEDGKLQSLFELSKVKYVGCDSFSSMACYDKMITKLILEKFSIPQVPCLIYRDDLNLKDIEYPAIVKPCKCGSSIGINVAHNKKELKKAIKVAEKYDKNIIIEKYIEKNRELECAVLENGKRLIVSDIGEIVNNGKWYDYDSKYKSKTDTIISNIDESIKNEIKDFSKKIFNILQCKSLSRIDFLYDISENKIYFNEINTLPGFTSISMYPKLIKDFGIDYKDLITILLSI